jgi:hypothetical protein
MTVLFQPDTCLPKDPAGWGLWLSGHSAEHERMRVICLGLSTPIIIPSFNVLDWRDEPELVQSWLVQHEALHQALRVATNITGADLSLVDLSNEEEWFLWLDDHAQEHAAFREVLHAG